MGDMVKVPSESDWSRWKSAALCVESSGTRTSMAPAKGQPFLRATPETVALAWSAWMVNLTEDAGEIVRACTETSAPDACKDAMCAKPGGARSTMYLPAGTASENSPFALI